MMKSPGVAKSKQWVTPGPRVRHWAARLALLVACVGSVATSPTSFEASVEYEGQPVLLTPAHPALTRTLVASVSVDEAMSAHISASLMAQLTVTWKPTDPTRPEKPTLRLKLRSQDSTLPESATLKEVVIEQPLQRVNVDSDPFGCALDQACELRFLFTLELLPGSAQGALEVNWKVVATAYTNDTLDEPKGFTMQLTEP